MNTAFGGPPFAVQQFLFRQPQQVTRIIDTLGGALPRHFVVLAQKGWQAQLFQMMFQ